MRRIGIVIATGLLLLTVGAAPALAAGPTQVVIVATHTGVGPEDVATFQAGGAGLCPTGSVYVVDGMVTGGPSAHKNFLVIQAFVCDAAAGFTNDDYFIVRIQAHTTIGMLNDYGTWQVIDGGGAFARLQGTGTLVGIYPETGDGITDYFSGSLK